MFALDWNDSISIRWNATVKAPKSIVCSNGWLIVSFSFLSLRVRELRVDPALVARGMYGGCSCVARIAPLDIPAPRPIPERYIRVIEPTPEGVG